ncbi:hypothetical protein D3C85_637120 [compost metagenome]
MALRHMADLVRQHGRQFRLRLRRQHQGRVHADEAARQGKRVQLGIAHGKEEIVVIRFTTHAGARRHERVAEGIQVFEQGRVVEVVAVAADAAHDFLADLALHRRRQVFARRVTQVRQVRRRRHGQRRPAASRLGRHAGGRCRWRGRIGLRQRTGRRQP